MHIEKNVFDNIFYTVIDVKGKTKDNIKARMDFKEVCHKSELELQNLSNGKVLKSKARYALTRDQKNTISE